MNNPATQEIYQSKKDDDIMWYDIVIACRTGKTLVFYHGRVEVTVRYSKLQAVMYGSADPRADFKQLCTDIGLTVGSQLWTENEIGVPMVECRIREYGPV